MRVSMCVCARVVRATCVVRARKRRHACFSSTPSTEEGNYRVLVDEVDLEVVPSTRSFSRNDRTKNSSPLPRLATEIAKV